jgi:phenylacetate-CoA ligase
MKYSHILESVLIPAYYGFRGRRYPERRSFMERSQWWSRERIQEFQWRELRNLLEHAYRSVPFYREKYATAGIELGDIKSREDFAEVPVLTRDEINARRTDLCAQPESGRLIPHATGGSSGVPTRFFITLNSYDWRCAASDRAYSWSGYRTGERTLYLWGAPVGKVSQFKQAKLNSYRFFRRELFIPTFLQTPELWQSTFEAALRFRPKFIVGYVSSIEQFVRFLLDRDLRIPGVKAVLAGAEPVYKSTRELVMAAFRAPLFDTYGSREFMSIAAECEYHDGLHIHCENLLVETELDATYGSSEILVTDLHNYGTPFIRYRIGDVGMLSDTACPCGRGLPLISRIEGRSLEVLRTRDGKAVSPIVWRHVLKDLPEVKEFQIQQKNLDEIVLFLVLEHSLSDRSETLLRREMAKVFSPATRLIIKPVQAIPQLPSGKRRLAVGIGQLN